MPNWGVTDDGYYRPLYPEVRQYLESTYKGRFGQTTNTAHHTPDGMFVSFLAEVVALLYEDDEATWGSQFFDTTDGVSADLWFAGKGFRRNPARATTFEAPVLGTEGTVVEVGTLIRETATQQLYELVEEHTITDPATNGSWQARETGPHLVEDSPGFMVISGPNGFTGIGEPTNINVGNDLETVAEAKARYRDAIQGDSIVKIALRKLPGVTVVEKFENDTDIPDDYWGATHWVEYLVVGGDDQDIANTIQAYKADGVGTRGDTEITETFSGEGNTIRFTRGTDVDVYLTIVITPGERFPSQTTALSNQIRDDIVAWANANHAHSYDVAPDLFRGQIAASISTPGARYSAAVYVGTDPDPSSTGILSIAPREVARFAAGRTTVQFA